MGWHRNHAISHSPNQTFFEDTFVSHPGGPNEQFGTHEKLSWGVQGNLNWMPGYIPKWESEKITRKLRIHESQNISQQVTTMLQGTDKTV